jgi:hypothetical protein
MTETTAGEARTARVLAPDFVHRLEDVDLDDLRSRRDDALNEREFQSYLRRLIQVRKDILVAERDRRRTGAQPQPLVERLKHVLAEGPQGRGRGEVLRVTLPDADAAEAERRADAMISQADLAGPEALSDQLLEQALGALDQGERTVSADRAAVLRVHDRLQEELKRRYREDPSQIPTQP